jgi:hypothetical protein
VLHRTRVFLADPFLDLDPDLQDAARTAGCFHLKNSSSCDVDGSVRSKMQNVVHVLKA